MRDLLMMVHMFSIMGGGAAGIGNGILMTKVMAGGGPPPDIVRGTMKALGRVGLFSILLLWASGITMVLVGQVAFSTLFIIKLVGAAAVLGAVLALTAHTTKAEREKRPPNLKWMMKVARVSQLGVVVAVIFAVLAFN